MPTGLISALREPLDDAPDSAEEVPRIPNSRCWKWYQVLFRSFIESSARFGHFWLLISHFASRTLRSNLPLMSTLLAAAGYAPPT